LCNDRLRILDLHILNPLRSLVVFELRLSARQRRFRFRKNRAVIRILQFDKSLPGLYRFKVVDVHLAHFSRNAGAHRRYIGSHVCIIRALFGFAAFPRSPTSLYREQEDSSDSQDDNWNNDRSFQHFFSDLP
jgi:hypothetical protein